MSEEFREYRRNNRTRQKNDSPKVKAFIKRLMKQAVISVIIFISILTLKTIAPQNKVTSYIQRALTYKINIGDIKLFLDNMINLPKDTSASKEGSEIEAPTITPEEAE